MCINKARLPVKEFDVQDLQVVQDPRALIRGYAAFADQLSDLVVVLIWAVLGTILAVRGFSWEARRG